MDIGCRCECIPYLRSAGEFAAGVIRTTRKERVCGECARVIEVGERYERAAGKTSGDMWTAVTCMSCVRLRNDLLRCWFYGEVLDQIHACVCQDGEEPFCVCGIEERDKRRKNNASN